VAYTRIKAIDPTIIVVSGAPASTAVDSSGIAISDIRYYSAMFSYENGIIRNYVDALGVHPGGSANPPETFWPDAPSPAQGWTDHPTFYFRNVERIRRLMEEYGLADLPVWITEFGWATRNKYARIRVRQSGIIRAAGAIYRRSDGMDCRTVSVGRCHVSVEPELRSAACAQW
jgi:hypothetical protein